MKKNLDILATQIVAEQIERYGNATIETFAGMDTLTKVAKQYMNCSPNITQGRLFEIIEATKFNKDAALKGESLRAFTTDSLGDPHAAADILIKDGDTLIKEVQAKSGAKAASLARMVSSEKYGDMDRLVNSEKADKVKELVEKRANSQSIYAKDYEQAAPHINGKLEADNITSGGTTYEEALKATNQPQTYALKEKIYTFAEGTFSSMMNGALAGACVGGGVSLVQQTVEICKSEKQIKDGFIQVGKDSGKQAGKSAAVAGIAHGIKFIGKDSVMMKGNVAAALASSAVRLTESSYQLIKGKLSIEEFLEIVGENAVTTFSGIVFSAAGAMLLGPVGAAVGATVAMLGMKQLYGAFTRAQQELELTIEERKRAEELSKVLIDYIKQEEERICNFYQETGAKIEHVTGLVKQTIHTGENIEATIHQLAENLNVSFKFKNQDEFNSFMLSEESFIL